jgi:hypothetical protein
LDYLGNVEAAGTMGFSMPLKAWVCLFIAEAFAISVAIAWWRELSDVNRKLSDSEKFPLFGGYGFTGHRKYKRVDLAYKQFYPVGRLIRIREGCALAMFLSIAACVYFV